VTLRQLPLPTVTASINGRYHVIWDTGWRLLEVSIYPSNAVDWFYKDRATGAHEGSETPTTGVPLRVLELLIGMATEPA
jgi:hypothetical protein